MSSVVIAFMFSAGVAVWIYSKLMKYTGNNNKSSLIAAAAIFIFSFFVSWAIFSFLTGIGK
jgi:hypothetical protein